MHPPHPKRKRSIHHVTNKIISSRQTYNVAVFLAHIIPLLVIYLIYLYTPSPILKSDVLSYFPTRIASKIENFHSYSLESNKEVENQMFQLSEEIDAFHSDLITNNHTFSLLQTFYAGIFENTPDIISSIFHSPRLHSLPQLHRYCIINSAFECSLLSPSCRNETKWIYRLHVPKAKENKDSQYIAQSWQKMLGSRQTALIDETASELMLQRLWMAFFGSRKWEIYLMRIVHLAILGQDNYANHRNETERLLTGRTLKEDPSSLAYESLQIYLHRIPQTKLTLKEFVRQNGVQANEKLMKLLDIDYR